MNGLSYLNWFDLEILHSGRYCNIGHFIKPYLTLLAIIIVSLIVKKILEYIWQTLLKRTFLLPITLPKHKTKTHLYLRIYNTHDSVDIYLKSTDICPAMMEYLQQNGTMLKLSKQRWGCLQGKGFFVNYNVNSYIGLLAVTPSSDDVGDIQNIGLPSLLEVPITSYCTLISILRTQYQCAYYVGHTIFTKLNPIFISYKELKTLRDQLQVPPLSPNAPPDRDGLDAAEQENTPTMEANNLTDKYNDDTDGYVAPRDIFKLRPLKYQSIISTPEYDTPSTPSTSTSTPGPHNIIQTSAHKTSPQHQIRSSPSGFYTTVIPQYDPGCPPSETIC